MSQRTYLDIGGEYHVDHDSTAWGPHGLWYYPNGQFGEPNRDKYNAPYGYSPFFIFGNHKTIEEAETCYSDRYHLWGGEKMEAGLAAAGIKGLACHSPALVPKIALFIKAYHGEQFELVGVVEWCNVGNGYPCWSFHFKDRRHA